MRKIGVLLSLFAFIFCMINAAEDERSLKVNAIKKLNADESGIGKQWLVLIAISKYKEWPGLKNPVKDAKELKEILTERYYFDEVVELYDEQATAVGIRNLFMSLKTNVRPEDSVFLFYAGHGYLDENSNTGFWAPQDAGQDEVLMEKWIPNSQIRGYIGNIKVKHFALVSDSCFSGDILNVMRDKPPVMDDEKVKQAYKRLSRQALTAGASETVPDESEFTKSLKNALIYNNKPYMDMYTLYAEIKTGVTKTIPLLGSFQGTASQDGGSYILFLKENKEENKFNGIKNIEDCDNYIAEYPNGRYIKDVNLKKEKMYYEAAANKSSCDAYLAKYTDGSYKAEVEQKREEYSFGEIKTLEDMKEYSDRYPKGKYINQVRVKMEEIMYSNIVTLDDCNAYIQIFPMGANIDRVREKREKIIITGIKNVEDCDKYLIEFASSKNAPIVIDKRDRYIVDNIKSVEECDSFMRFNRESLYISQVKEKREMIMAETADTIEKCDKYLIDYPIGKYVSVVNSKRDRLSVKSETVDKPQKESKASKKEMTGETKKTAKEKEVKQLKNVKPRQSGKDAVYLVEGKIGIMEIPDFDLSISTFELKAGRKFGKIILDGNITTGKTDKKLNSGNETYTLLGGGGEAAYSVFKIPLKKLKIELTAGAGYQGLAVKDGDGNQADLSGIYLGTDLKIHYKKLTCGVGCKIEAGSGREWMLTGFSIGGEF